MFIILSIIAGAVGGLIGFYTMEGFKKLYWYLVNKDF